MIVAESDPNTGDQVFKFRVRAPIPVDLSLVIGDAVHNLRSALDHLAWQLVLANGQTPTTQTAYPA